MVLFVPPLLQVDLWAIKFYFACVWRRVCVLNLLQRLNEVKGQILGCWRLWLPRQKHGLYIKSRFKCIFVYEVRNHQITIITQWRCGPAVERRRSWTAWF